MFQRFFCSAAHLEKGLKMEFLFDLQALSELIDSTNVVTDPIWTNVCDNIFVVAARSAEEDGFYQGMGYLIPTSNWIASTAHIMQHSGSLPPQFYDLQTGEEIETQRSVVKHVGAAQSVDVTMHEASLPAAGKLKKRDASVHEDVVVFQAIFTKEAMDLHHDNGSKFIVTEAVIIAVSEGTVSGVKDGIIEHSAFTTKGSSGAPVFARDGSALLGMSFYREEGKSFAESNDNIWADMSEAVRLLAAQQTRTISQSRQTSNKSNHYASMAADTNNTSYDTECAVIDIHLKQQVSEADDRYNEQRRLLKLSGELVDKFVPAKGNKELVLEMIEEIELRFITEHYASKGCKTIFQYPAGHSPVLRFDKQLGTVAKFAIQPNSHSGKGEYKNESAKGIVYSQITVNKTSFGAYLNGNLTHITEDKLLENIRTALRESLTNKPMGTVDVIFPAALVVEKESAPSAKDDRGKAFREAQEATYDL